MNGYAYHASLIIVIPEYQNDQWIEKPQICCLNPFIPKFKKYILPTFLKSNVWVR